MSLLINILHILFSIPILLGFAIFTFLIIFSFFFAAGSSGWFVFISLKKQLKILFEQLHTKKSLIQIREICACQLSRNGRVHVFTHWHTRQNTVSHHYSGHCLNDVLHLIETKELNKPLNKKWALSNSASTSICPSICRGARHCPYEAQHCSLKNRGYSKSTQAQQISQLIYHKLQTKPVISLKT